MKYSTDFDLKANICGFLVFDELLFIHDFRKSLSGSWRRKWIKFLLIQKLGHKSFKKLVNRKLSQECHDFQRHFTLNKIGSINIS